MNRKNLPHVLSWIVILIMPFWLSIGAARLLMTEAYLYFEYSKPDFPEDYYGFTMDDRRTYAPYAVQYMTNSSDISYLADLTFPDGTPQYNARELRHMEDVKGVTQTFLQLHTLITLALIWAAVWAWRDPLWRDSLRESLARGAYLTLALMFSLIALIAISWDTFFNGFHQLLFEAGTWQFEYSDTLIRLFPERFWFDAAVTLGILIVLSAGILIGGMWLWARRSKKAVPADTASGQPDE